MLKYYLGVSVIVLVYFCLLVIAFCPTLYAVWIYVVGRKVKVKKKSMGRVVLSTLCVNLIFVYFTVHLMYEVVLPHKVAEIDGLVSRSMENAIAAEKSFFGAHGRYYSVGPVRGPYADKNGLKVEKDVILQVEPHWDKTARKESYKAYGVHVFGKRVFVSANDDKVQDTASDAELSARIRSKLINSVK
jgi:hypothetical protein